MGRSNIRPFAFTALLALAFALPAATAARADVYFGATIAGETYGERLNAPLNETAWDRFEEHADKRVAILNLSQGFGQFDPYAMDATRARGAIPLVSMGLAEGVTIESIAEGEQDSEIREWAKEAKAWGHPFFFDPWWEMNGAWFPWGRNPDFVKAWRHFHDLVVAEGATNVTWTWVPNGIWADPGSDPAPYYPGDAYVDWTGIDSYNWGRNPAQPNRWFNPDQTISPTLARVGEIAPGKPVMIAEDASTEIGGNKAAWIREMLSTYLPRHPQIGAYLWFNWSDQKAGGTEDWPIESSAAAQQAFRGAIQTSFFRPAPVTLPDLTKVPPPQPPVAAAETSAEDISDPGGRADSPRVALAPDGTATVVWTEDDGSGPAIYERRIDADGALSSAPVLVSGPGEDAISPDLAIAPDGTATIVWVQSDGQNLLVRARRVSPEGVLAAETAALSSTGQDAQEPRVAVAPDGTATVVWKRFDGTTKAGYLIKERRIGADGTLDETPAATLSETGQSADEPAVAVAENGSATVVWSRFDGTGPVVQESRVGPEGTPGPAADLSAAGGSAIEPRVAAMPGGEGAALAVWTRNDGSDGIVQARRIDASGVPEASASDISAPGRDALEPDLAVAADDSATVAWIRSDGADYVVQARRLAPDGSPESSAVGLSSAGSDAIEPRLAVNAGGAATAAWARLDGSDFIVEARGLSASGEPAAASRQLSAPGRGAGEPAIAIAPNGALTAAWRRFDGAEDAVQGFTHPIIAAGGGPPPVSPRSVGPDHSFAIGRPILNRRKGTAKLPVTVPGPGTVALGGAPGSAHTVTVAGTVALLVRPRGRAKSHLKPGSHLKVRVEVTFTPEGGQPNTRAVSVGLRRAQLRPKRVRRGAGRTAKPRA